MVQIEVASGAFLLAFSKFEMNDLGLALRALSKDDAFVVQSEKLLGLEARLTLLERLAFARELSKKLMNDLSKLLLRSRALCEQHSNLTRALEAGHAVPMPPPPQYQHRSFFARLAEASAAWTPSLAQVETYLTETLELQKAFRAFAETIDPRMRDQSGACLKPVS